MACFLQFRWPRPNKPPARRGERPEGIQPRRLPEESSMTTPAEVLSMLKEKEIKFVDLRFTDTRGKEQHVTVPSHTIDAGFFDDGKMFDGSSISGWRGSNTSAHV